MRLVTEAQLKTIERQVGEFRNALSWEVFCDDTFSDCSNALTEISEETGKNLFAKALGYTDWSHLANADKDTTSQKEEITVFEDQEKGFAFVAKELNIPLDTAKSLVEYLNKTGEHSTMNTISIDKTELVELIAESTDAFGSPSLTIYVDIDGEIDARYNSEPSEGWMPVLALSDMGAFVDEHGNLPHSPDYNSQGVAKQLVDAKERLTLKGELDGIKYDFKIDATPEAIEAIVKNSEALEDCLLEFFDHLYVQDVTEPDHLSLTRSEAAAYQFTKWLYENKAPEFADNADKTFDKYAKVLLDTIDELGTEGKLAVVSGSIFQDACDYYGSIKGLGNIPLEFLV